MQLRDYQIDLAERGLSILKKHKICYLAIEMRVGKTLISLDMARQYEAKSVLFVTKKKAIPSIISDYEGMKYNYSLDVVNYEAVHKLTKEYDLVIIDEAHSLGAYPKPSLRTKRLKAICNNNPLILLSGTPTPESWSQIYHQLWVSLNSPFKKWSTFYKWGKDFVDVKKRIINGYHINDYSKADQKRIERYCKKLFIKYSQEDAGFKYEIEEDIRYVPLSKNIDKLLDRLIKDKVYILKSGGTILGDTAVKLMSKVHQISSGTVITEEGDYLILDKSKAEYIKKEFKNKKIGIFYVFKSEEAVLREVLGDLIVATPEEFNKSTKPCVYISQVLSGSMGINLSSSDYIIYYNIMYSSMQYWQSRARGQSLDNVGVSNIIWLFNKSDLAIERKIKKVVNKKKDFTTYYFKKEYNI